MWWLRRSGVVVCAKSFRPDFQTQAREPRLFFATATSSHPLRKMQNSTFIYSLSTISRLHSATYRRQPSSCQNKKIGDESRRYPRQVSLFFFWWERVIPAEREACTSGAGVKVSCTRAARRAITWARPRPSSLSGRTLPWKLGESCVPDKAPSRTAFYRLRRWTFYYY